MASDFSAAMTTRSLRMVRTVRSPPHPKVPLKPSTATDTQHTGTGIPGRCRCHQSSTALLFSCRAARRLSVPAPVSGPRAPAVAHQCPRTSAITSTSASAVASARACSRTAAPGPVLASISGHVESLPERESSDAEPICGSTSPGPASLSPSPADYVAGLRPIRIHTDRSGRPCSAAE